MYVNLFKKNCYIYDIVALSTLFLASFTFPSMHSLIFKMQRQTAKSNCGQMYIYTLHIPAFYVYYNESQTLTKTCSQVTLQRGYLYRLGNYTVAICIHFFIIVVAFSKKIILVIIRIVYIIIYNN